MSRYTARHIRPIRAGGGGGGMGEHFMFSFFSIFTFDDTIVFVYEKKISKRVYLPDSHE